MIKVGGIAAIALTAICFLTGQTEAKTQTTQKSVVHKEWTESTKRLHSAIVKAGMETGDAAFLINTCKASASNPRHCVIYASAVAKAESGLGRESRNGNMFGVTGFKGTHEEAIKQWVGKYNKFWYKATNAAFFYPPAGGVSRSRYCTDEESSGSKKGCPNGLKHSSYIISLLTNVQ